MEDSACTGDGRRLFLYLDTSNGCRIITPYFCLQESNIADPDVKFILADGTNVTDKAERMRILAEHHAEFDERLRKEKEADESDDCEAGDWSHEITVHFPDPGKVWDEHGNAKN